MRSAQMLKKQEWLLWLGNVSELCEGPAILKPGPPEGSGEFRATEMGILKLVIF